MQNPFYMGSKQAEHLAQQGKEGEEEEGDLEEEEGEEEEGKEERDEAVGSEHSLEQIDEEEEGEENP